MKKIFTILLSAFCAVSFTACDIDLNFGGKDGGGNSTPEEKDAVLWCDAQLIASETTQPDGWSNGAMYVICSADELAEWADMLPEVDFDEYAILIFQWMSTSSRTSLDFKFLRDNESRNNILRVTRVSSNIPGYFVVSYETTAIVVLQSDITGDVKLQDLR